jgi:hypothetical protein
VCFVYRNSSLVDGKNKKFDMNVTRELVLLSCPIHCFGLYEFASQGEAANAHHSEEEIVLATFNLTDYNLGRFGGCENQGWTIINYLMRIADRVSNA